MKKHWFVPQLRKSIELPKDKSGKTIYRCMVCGEHITDPIHLTVKDKL